jgi:hypothetical protein
VPEDEGGSDGTRRRRRRRRWGMTSGVCDRVSTSPEIA